jgi:hypothetical protein
MVLENTWGCDLIKDILNMLQFKSKLGICLKMDNKIIFSDSFWSDYCRLINQTCSDICLKEFENSNEIHPCEAGLYCASFRIVLGKDLIGSISLGHRRLNGYDDKTKECLLNLYSNGKIKESEYELLKEYLNSVDIIDKDSLKAAIDRHIPMVQKYLYSEKANEERIAELKTLSTYLAHSFLTPIQAIVARTENLLNDLNRTTVNPALIENCDAILDEVTKLSYSAENLRDWMEPTFRTFGLQF